MVAGAAIFVAGHGTFFAGDDWEMMLTRWGVSPDALLIPHNEHLVATQVLLYEATRKIAGWHYGAYRIDLMVLHLAVAACVFTFARRRVGSWLAAGLTVPMLVLAGDATMWPPLSGNVASVVAGLAAVLVMDRWPTSVRRDLAVCALLLLSVASFSYGLAFALAVGIWVAATPGGRRSLWVPAVPLLVYLLWVASYHPPSAISFHNAADTLQFAADSLAASFGTVTGLGLAWGRLLALVAVVAVAYELGAHPDRRSPTTYALVALPLMTWVLTGLGRAARGPGAPTFFVGADAVTQRFARLEGTLAAAQSKYTYPTVVMLVLLAAQLLRGRKMRTVLALAAALALCGIVTNAVQLDDSGRSLRGVADEVRGRLVGIELADRTISPQFTVYELPGSPDFNVAYLGHFHESSFRRANRAIGSEPVPLTAFGELGPAARTQVDAVLVNTLPVRLSPTTGRRVPRRCTHLPARRHGIGVPEPAGTAIIRAGGQPATVLLRRFADPGKTVPAGIVPAHGASALGIPPDRSSRPWLLTVQSGAPLDLCR